MRQWHRRLGIFAAVFMFFIALTGALLQGQMMLGGSGGPPGAGGPGAPAGPAASAGVGGAAGAGGAPAGPPPVSDAQVQALLASSLAGAHRQSPGALMGIELRLNGAPTAEVVVAEPTMRRIRLDARTGAPLDDASKPGHRDWHGVLLDLHRGAFAGATGQWISLACGVVLTVLSVTGLVVYLQLWRRRRANKQPAFVW